MNQKILYVLIKLFLLLPLFHQAVSAAAPLNPYSPESIRRFADFLYDDGDYLRAAGEYQRYLFYRPQDSGKIQYKIAICYRLGGKPEGAIHAFEVLLQRYPKSSLVSSAYYQIGVSFFVMEAFEKSESFLRDKMPRIVDVRYRLESEQLVGLSYLMRKRWVEAGEIFSKLQDSEIAALRAKAMLYGNYAEQGSHLRSRSPFLAGLFSTFLPGSGRLYTGRTGDAVASLVIVGLTGWQAYTGFRKNGVTSLKGWSFGTIAGIFYLGNIYGSIISARAHNRTVENEFLTTLLIELPY